MVIHVTNGQFSHSDTCVMNISGKKRSACSSENVLLPITKSGLKGYVLRVQFGLMSILLFHVFLCFVGFQFSLEEFIRL